MRPWHSPIRDNHGFDPTKPQILTIESHWLGAIAFAAVALVAGASHDASAQPYPQRPVTLINPSAAGGSNEALKTIIFDRVAAALGKPIVMESRSGAGGAIAASFVAKAEPNGYTLFLAGSSVMGSNPATKKDLPYDAVRDFTPIVILVEAPLLLVTHRSIPVTGAREFVDLLRAQPGRLNYGSYGSGTTNFLAYELFKNVTGTDVLHVPYRGSAPLLTALMAAEVQTAFEYHPTIRPHVEAGTFRILGVASASRFRPLPDVPTLGEQGIAVEAGGSVWLVAPAGLPAPVADRLNAEVNKVLAEPEVRRRLAEIGYEAVGGTREQASGRIADDIAKWTRLVRAIGYRPESSGRR